MINLDRATVRAVRGAGEQTREIEVLTAGGVTVLARAHDLLVGTFRSGAMVTVAWDPAARGSSDVVALVVRRGEGASLPDPRRFAGTPVVVSSPGSARVGKAARDAGARAVAELAVQGDEPTIWQRLIERFTVDGPEVVDVSTAQDDLAAIRFGGVLEGASLLGMRPVAALRIDGAPKRPHAAPGPLDALRDHCRVPVDVAVPAFEDPVARRLLWDDLRRDRLEERHQLVEVDVRTAGLGQDPRPEDLGPDAAGILAGRMAVAARRWRRP